MIGRREDIARFHSDLYRNNYYKLITVVLVECAIILALILAIVYFVLTQAPARYYVTTSSGLVIPIVGHKG